MLPDRSVAVVSNASVSRRGGRPRAKAIPLSWPDGKTALPGYQPFANGRPEPAEAWWPHYLLALAKFGREYIAAAAVGYSPRTVQRRLLEHPELAEEAEDALTYYKQALECELVALGRRTNNPLPYFARLKAELPNRYLDKAVILSATVDVNALEEKDGRALLAALMGEMREPARQLVAGQVVIELPPVVTQEPGSESSSVSVQDDTPAAE